jgi:phosphoglycolate phosphatase
VSITVGFDLDMTLIDARPGVVLAMAALAEETGVAVDGEYVAAHMGPPLPTVMREMGVPEGDVDDLVARFRQIYAPIAIPQTKAMPGAEESLTAVRAVGGKTMIVTAKYQRNADLHVQALGWDVDHVVGDLWSAGKAEALKLHGASIYVGDHIGDMAGAAAAEAFAVGVATGPCSVEELRDAGAHVVLTSLTEFPAWFDDYAARR